MKNNLNFYQLIFKFSLLGFLILASPVQAQVNQKSDQLINLKIHKNAIELPNIEFTDLHGNKFSNENLKKQISVINLWATWCPPCVKELPSFDRLSTLLAKENIKIYVVSQDKAGNKVVPPYFEKLKLQNLKIYLDNQSSLMKSFRTPVLPTTIIVDRNGMEVSRLVGEINWDSPEVITYLKNISNQK
jgi:thiol-disulfide isomerase/thioredoxin